MDDARFVKWPNAECTAPSGCESHRFTALNICKLISRRCLYTKPRLAVSLGKGRLKYSRYTQLRAEHHTRPPNHRQ